MPVLGGLSPSQPTVVALARWSGARWTRFARFDRWRGLRLVDWGRHRRHAGRSTGGVGIAVPVVIVRKTVIPIDGPVVDGKARRVIHLGQVRGGSDVRQRTQRVNAPAQYDGVTRRSGRERIGREVDVDDAIGIGEVLDEHHAPRFELRSHGRSDQGPLLGGGRRATTDG